jgi:hypothetical protein
MEAELISTSMAEVEHILERPSDCVKRAIADLAEPPIILDEANYGGLVCHTVIDEVALGIG